MGDTAYARCGDLSLAYQVFGEGPVDLVISGSFVSNVELWWTSPEAKSFFDRLGTFARVLLYDKAGVGLSDPVPKVRSIEERAMELEAVMDAAGFGRAALMGISEGGPASIMFAATRPERVQALILAGTFAHVSVGAWADLDGDPAVALEHLRTEHEEQYLPTVEQVAGLQRFGRAIRDNWGKGEALGILLPSITSRAQLGMLERMSASPGMAMATVQAAMQIDVRAVLPTISVPTVVIHALDDPVPIQGGRYLADHIPGARMVEFKGTDHAPWFTEPDKFVKEVEQLLTGAHHVQTGRRVLRAVLFTDVVSSTERAAALGDERWRATLERVGQVTAEAVDRHGGQLVKNMGDGHLATFDGPAQAIRCAEAIRTATEAIGLEIRAGVHAGECEVMGDDIGGMAVHIAARVMAQAGAGEIVVSSTVRDLVVGSGLGFDDRGTHELKGVPGPWQLLAVRPDGAAPGSVEARLTSLATPSTRSAMTRSDKAVHAVARRAPGLFRSFARLTSKAAPAS